MTITFLVSVTGHMVSYVTCSNWSSLVLLTTFFNYPFHTPPTPAITLTVLVLYLEGWHTLTFLKELIFFIIVPGLGGCTSLSVLDHRT